RGDADRDGELSISDPVATLQSLFVGGAPLTCSDAADTNDDGRLDITDAIYTLNFLFLGGVAPLPPYPAPGPDPSDDPLSCES
ncbi:MAG: hypothetical protein AAF517_26920, partial [Planctomycetota bacterium]